jgi:asparagine N-glycosylation enzyme membrane subunit Stt3
VIDAVLNIAGYTYGPLLGLFAFGLFTKLQVRDKLVPIVCVLSPAISYLLSLNSERFFGGYKIGLEILLINGMITFFGLWLISRKDHAAVKI